MRAWLLPEYVEDILPEEASRIERMRRAVLDLFVVHGYQMVMPPMIEYLESLLTGTGRDLDLQTFKLVDQLSGRTLGVRADITPQVARIDAHLLNRSGVARLCYAGSVLRTRPDGPGGTREPLQIGAEIYGHAGVESDIEIQQLMIKALDRVGIGALHLDIGHVAVFRSLVRRGAVPAELEERIFRAVQAKDAPTLRTLCRGMERTIAEALALLPELCGGTEVLRAAQRHLPAYPELRAALRTLRRLSAAPSRVARVRCFDLAELRGYRYHSGVVFAAYADGWANALAVGGRYDEVGSAFGRARPATGFSMDLREMVGVRPGARAATAIRAPYRPGNTSLQKRIEALRVRGEVVIEELPGHVRSRAELGCDRRLVLSAGRWVVERLKACPET